jgi:threonine/homoserine/homoserine lactone efflux protein
MTLVHILPVVIAWMVAAGSPGPATLAISGTAMRAGRRAGLSIAAGICCGSASWGVAAGLGMSAVMLANAWVFEAIRYAGAGYLLYLAARSLRSGLGPAKPLAAAELSGRRLFARGLLLHLTNPKAMLSWGAIYAIALPAGAGPDQVWLLFAMLISGSTTVFLGYGLLFSDPRVAAGYGRLRRGFDLAFAGLFGAASLELLLARIR